MISHTRNRARHTHRMQWRKRSSTNRKAFYLHDDGALDFEKEIACVAKHFNIAANNTTGARGHLNWDTGGSTLGIRYAEHLGEVAILRDMRNHPMRTMDPMSTKIHILGFPALLAFLANSVKTKKSSGHSSHSCLKSRTAIKKAGAEARKRYELYTHAAFVLVFTYWDVSKLEQFSSSFGKNGHDRLFVGTSDPKFTHRGTERGNFTEIGSFDPLHTIVVPYRSNYELDADLSQQTVQGRSGNKSVTFFFAGAFDRRFEGELRGPTMRAMQHGDGVHGGGNNNAVLIDRSISKIALTKTIAQETMSNFRRSAFCLAPAGDTPTSRRVFEALAAGCVPVYMGGVKAAVNALPFHHSVDWSKTMLFAGEMKCLTEHNGAQAKVLATFLTEHGRSSPHLGLDPDEQDRCRRILAQS